MTWLYLMCAIGLGSGVTLLLLAINPNDEEPAARHAADAGRGASSLARQPGGAGARVELASRSER